MIDLRSLVFFGRAHRLLALAAVASLAACGGKPATDASQVVATVNKSEISVHQINHVLQRQPGLQPAQLDTAGRQALDRLVEQELAVQQALDMKLDREPAVMQSLAAARREVLARAYAGKVAETATKPDATDLKAYYDARPALFAQRRIYALQEFAVQADAQQLESLRQRVTSAKSLTEVTDYLRVQKLGVRASQSTQPAENLPPALVEKLVAMKDGQLLLLAAPGGARIVVLAGSRPAPVSLEQARGPIEQAIAGERRRKAVQASIDAARKASEIKFFGKFAVAPAAASAPPGSGEAATAAASASAPDIARPADMAASAAEEAAILSKGLAGLK